MMDGSGKIDGIDPVLAQNIGMEYRYRHYHWNCILLNILLVIIASLVFLYETVKVPVIYEMYMDDEDATQNGHYCGVYLIQWRCTT